jgi:hypothetical protein
VEIGSIKGDAGAVRWLAYTMCKAVWRFEPGFREKRMGEKNSAEYSWSSREEQECVSNYIEGALNYESNARTKKKQPEIPIDQLAASAPDDVPFLYEVMKAGMLDDYVLFEDIGRRCPFAVSVFQIPMVDGIEKYIRKFVVVHPGPRGPGKLGLP